MSTNPGSSLCYVNSFLGLTYGFLNNKKFQEVKLFICHCSFITLAQKTTVRFLETLQIGYSLSLSSDLFATVRPRTIRCLWIKLKKEITFGNGTTAMLTPHTHPYTIHDGTSTLKDDYHRFCDRPVPSVNSKKNVTLVIKWANFMNHLST